MKHVITIIIALLIIDGAKAQISPFSEDYYHNPALFNPALLARNNFSSVNFTVYQRWSLIESPVRSSLSFSTKFKKSGVAVSAMTDINGVLRTSGMGFSYFYDAALTAKKHLVFSLSGYGLNESINFDNMESVDETAANLKPRYYPQTGAGILYYTPKLNIGLSATNLLKTTDFISRDSVINPPVFALDISYNYSHPIELYFFQPRLVLMRSKEFVMAEASFYFYLMKMLKIGAAWGSKGYAYGYGGDYFSALMGIKIKDKFFFNYRFDYVTSDFIPTAMRIHNSVSIIFNIYKETNEVPRFF